MSRILITGANGFVGSFLVREALDRGLEVYAGVRSTSNRALLSDKRINFIILDFEDEVGLRKTLSRHKFEYVIHNAGITRAYKAETYFKVNCDYSVLLARLCMDEIADLKKFVYISSLDSFGSADHIKDGVIREDSSPQPTTSYGLSKLRAERALKKIENLPLMIMRPTGVFGPGEKDFFTIFQTIKKYRFAPVIGTDKIIYTFVYVKDLARVTLDATLSKIVNRSYFVTDGKIYNIREFTDAVAKAFGVKSFGFTIPFFLVDILAEINGIIDGITGRRSLLNKEQVAKMKARSWDADISPLVKDLNYAGRYTMEDAVKETALWYEENNWL